LNVEVSSAAKTAPEIKAVTNTSPPPPPEPGVGVGVEAPGSTVPEAENLSSRSRLCAMIGLAPHRYR
jgi:hypothetical protein